MAVSMAPQETGESNVGEGMAEEFVPYGRRLDRAVLAFVALGVLLRVGHYLTNYPVWGDEACLALSFLRRGYLDLLSPLEYGQICPILFLWAELTAVKLFGFSEMSLRLCPLLCGVGSVFLFRHVAGRVLEGPALLMAVAIFAVSIHPIRHSAEAKPYATDLLVALGLLALAIEWFRSPERTDWLWMLVGFTPIALAASYPAVLVAGGIGLALAPSVWRTRRWGPKIALAAYVLVGGGDVRGPVCRGHASPAGRRGTGGSPAVLGRFLPAARLARTAGELADHDPRRQHVRLPLGGQSRGEQRDADPRAHRRGRPLAAGPQDDPRAPGDADGRGAGGRGDEALSLRRPGADHAVYRPGHLPDGRPGPEHSPGTAPPAERAGPRRSGSRPSPWPPWGSSHWRTTSGIRTGPSTIIRPASSPDDSGPSRPRMPRSPACSGISGSQRGMKALARTAIYLCNQQIYSPRQRRGGGPRWTLVTPERPLRCVAFDDAIIKSPAATAWLESIESALHAPQAGGPRRPDHGPRHEAMG